MLEIFLTCEGQHDYKQRTGKPRHCLVLKFDGRIVKRKRFPKPPTAKQVIEFVNRTFLQKDNPVERQDIIWEDGPAFIKIAREI